MPPKAAIVVPTTYSGAANLQALTTAKLPIVIDKKVSRQFADLYAAACAQLNISPLPCMQGLAKVPQAVQEVVLVQSVVDFPSSLALNAALSEAADANTLRMVGCRFSNIALHALLQFLQVSPQQEPRIVFDSCYFTNQQLEIIALLACGSERKVTLQFFDCGIKENQVEIFLELQQFPSKGGLIALTICQKSVNAEVIVRKIKEFGAVGTLRMLQLIDRDHKYDLQAQKNILDQFCVKGGLKQAFVRSRQVFIQGVLESNTVPELVQPKNYYNQLTAYLRQLVFTQKHVQDFLNQLAEDLKIVYDRERAVHMKNFLNSAEKSQQKTARASKVQKVEEPIVPFKLANRFVDEQFEKYDFKMNISCKELCQLLREFWSNLMSQVEDEQAQAFLFETNQTDRLLLDFLRRPEVGIFEFGQLDYLSVNGEKVEVDNIGSLQAFQVGNDLVDLQAE